MTQLAQYCKAYLLSEFRRYPAWIEDAGQALPESDEPDADTTPRNLSDDDVLFLHDSYVVTDGVYPDEHVIFDGVTDEWVRFCKEELHFEVPDYARDTADTTADA